MNRRTLLRRSIGGKVLLRRMTHLELAELDDSVRQVGALAERAWEERLFFLWWVISSVGMGWATRLRIERWRASRG
ncbi:MAG: hypothetical protein WCD24_13120 [Serratia inhibens]|uniref:hypothetical protein n=1 Tax=Serratia inhibens TaxID=2338073 RepID=UPI003C7EB3EF